MSRHRSFARATAVYSIVAVATLVLGAMLAFAAGGLAAERGQARALVTLGTKALSTGDRASAILSFERASLLAPRADFVRSALAAADVPAPGPWTARAPTWITPREWSFLAVAFGWSTGLSAAVLIARKRKGAFASRLAFGSGLAFVLSVGGVVESNLASRALAVVMVPTGALVAPYGASGASADLRTGQVVRVGERYGDFVRVRAPDGANGWVVSGVLRTLVDESI
jgi:hypothetical protein